MASIDTANLSLCDVFTTKHGAKIATIKSGEGPCIYTGDEYLRVVFEPSSFDKDPNSQRLNLILETTPQVLESFQKLDEWLIGYIAEHSERILKRKLSVEQVRANYASPIKLSEKGYPATLKTKMDLAPGKHAIACWSCESHERGKSREPPELWREYKVRPCLHVTHLWLMGQSMGPLVRITDAMLEPDESAAAAHKERVNPFSKQAC